MNTTEYKKWLKQVLKDRKQNVARSQHDIKFAKDQIGFWTKYLKDSEAALKERQAAVEEWKAGMQS
jgi:hypothetical protein